MKAATTHDALAQTAAARSAIVAASAPSTRYKEVDDRKSAEADSARLAELYKKSASELTGSELTELPLLKSRVEERAKRAGAENSDAKRGATECRLYLTRGRSRGVLAQVIGKS